MKAKTVICMARLAHTFFRGFQVRILIKCGPYIP